MGFHRLIRVLSAASEVVARGFYAATTLSAVDPDLDTANIKSGETIFGKAGSADVHDISDANAVVGDVKDPKTFYAVAGGKKTGTMPTVAIAPGSSAYPEGYHAGNGGGLPAIDADLAAGNIKDGVTIFNILGTYKSSLAEDVTGSDFPKVIGALSAPLQYSNNEIAPEGEFDIIAKTLVYDADSMAVAVGLSYAASDTTTDLKYRLYMGGVQVAESAFITSVYFPYILVGTRALSGSVECKLSIHNYDAVSISRYRPVNQAGIASQSAGIGIGSIKV